MVPRSHDATRVFIRLHVSVHLPRRRVARVFEFTRHRSSCVWKILLRSRFRSSITITTRRREAFIYNSNKAAVHGKSRVWCSFRAAYFPLLPDDVCVFCELLVVARGCVVGTSNRGVFTFFARKREKLLRFFSRVIRL